MVTVPLARFRRRATGATMTVRQENTNAPPGPGGLEPPVGGPLRTTAGDRVIQRASNVPGWLAALALLILLAAAWSATYAVGGSRTALPHLFYVPIVLSTVRFATRGALVTAVAATALCGPLMPLDSATGEHQQVLGWVIRGVMFVLIGSLAGMAVAVRERRYALELSEEMRTAITRSAEHRSPVDLALVAMIDEVTSERRFHIVYQPVYSLRDGRLLAVEALARFDVEPYRTPDLWFAAAEYAGRGVELELAAIEEAIHGAAGLPPDVALSVNASPATVGDPLLLDLVRANPDRPLTVEITEHAVIEDYPLLQATLAPLRELGVKVAVDDAGAGFASLRHIVLLAPDVIKLDISLAQDLSSSPLRRALGGSLIEFALHSNALLVVEGIEEQSDLHIWSMLGAHACQGYLLGRPGRLPVETSSDVVTDLRTVRAAAR